jgi:hypothetical protein
VIAFCVKRQLRQHDSKPDEVEENREKDDEDGRPPVHCLKNFAAIPY